MVPSLYAAPRTPPVKSHIRSARRSVDTLVGLELPPTISLSQTWPLPFRHGRRKRRCRPAPEGEAPVLAGRWGRA